MSHEVVCKHGYVHHVCTCTTQHGTLTIVCNDPAHQKEHRMTTLETGSSETVEELEARLAALRESAGVTPEDVAATAQDEADSGYEITPAVDPEAHDADGHTHEDEDEAPNVLTAFLVIVNPDGAAFATSELNKIGEITPAREATIVDMRRACNEVVHDVNAMQTAQHTVALMQQSAAEMAEQARNAKIAAKLQERGVKLPRR